jgi:VIT1/CCC1 family predicted Fe2+/Mn2+ transporter
MYVCTIPGADDATILWHSVLHYGLAALVVTVGAVFLALAVLAYRSAEPEPRPVSMSAFEERYRAR